MRNYRRSRWGLLATTVAILAIETQSQSIFTIAGGGSDDGRPANAVALSGPTEVAVDGFGNLYVSETGNHRVRKISLEAGLITTVAGNGSAGYTGDGGSATSASLDHPEGIAVASDGTLYIVHGSFAEDSVVRRVDPETGIISTYAGGDIGVETGDGGLATQAGLSLPERLAVDSLGNLYIGGASTVRRVDATTRIITTYAGDFFAFEPGDGGPATAAGLSFVRGLAFDRDDNLYIVDSSNFRVRRVNRQTRTISTVAGNGNIGTSGDGGPATMAALSFPAGIAIDEDGNLFIGGGADPRVRRVDAVTGIITTVAGRTRTGFGGDGGPATNALMDDPIGVAVDSNDNIYIADFQNNRVRRVDPLTDRISTFAGTGSEAVFIGDGGPATTAVLALGFAILARQSGERSGSMAIEPDGTIVFADTNHHRVRWIDPDTKRIETVAGTGARGFSGDGGAASAATFNFPTSVAVGSAGTLYIADNHNYRIRRVDPNGTVTTVVGSGTVVPGTPPAEGLPATDAFVSFPGPIAVDRNDRLLFSANLAVWRVGDSGLLERVAGTGTRGSDGDGGPATSARFENIAGLHFDDEWNLYAWTREDSVSTGRIRRIDAASGIIEMVAGGTKSGPPDAIGDGGPATAARVDPAGLAVDANGNIWMSSQLRIRRVDAITGIIDTVYGTSEPGWIGDNGPASQAGFALPTGIALTDSGDLVIIDAEADRLRAIYRCVSVSQPALVSPADDSSGLGSSTVLEWRSSVGAFRYDVYLDTANPPQRVIASDIETTSFSASNLDPLTTYYWRVVAKGDPFCDPSRTSTSSTRSFTTSSSCDAPGGF